MASSIKSERGEKIVDRMRDMEAEYQSVIEDLAEAIVTSPKAPPRPRGVHQLYLAAVGRSSRPVIPAPRRPSPLS